MTFLRPFSTFRPRRRRPRLAPGQRDVVRVRKLGCSPRMRRRRQAHATRPPHHGRTVAWTGVWRRPRMGLSVVAGLSRPGGGAKRRKKGGKRKKKKSRPVRKGTLVSRRLLAGAADLISSKKTQNQNPLSTPNLQAPIASIVRVDGHNACWVDGCELTGASDLDNKAKPAGWGHGVIFAPESSGAVANTSVTFVGGSGEPPAAATAAAAAFPDFGAISVDRVRAASSLALLAPIPPRLACARHRSFSFLFFPPPLMGVAAGMC